MPEAIFYILTSSSLNDRYLFACRLIEKAYRKGCICYVWTENAAESQRIDELLWTFRVGSFIPHTIFTGLLPDLLNRVLIGSAPPPDPWRKVLINLSPNLPADPSGFERILEVLHNDEIFKEAGRQRYRSYQSYAISMRTHAFP